MAEPVIFSVHCQLPEDIEPDNLNLDQNNWKWNKVLEFPADKLEELRLLKPYKWIRFAIGIVVGAHGELRREPDLSNSVPINYDDSRLPGVKTDLYYHTTDEEKGQMFPFDPELANAKVVTPSQTSTRRSHFRDDVARRDGQRCVVTRDFPYNQAAHLIPHSKGDTV